MTVTIGGWIGILIGFSAGGIFGLLAGIFMADEHWRKKSESILGMKDCDMAPYEIEKGD